MLTVLVLDNCSRSLGPCPPTPIAAMFTLCLWAAGVSGRENRVWEAVTRKKRGGGGRRQPPPPPGLPCTQSRERLYVPRNFALTAAALASRSSAHWGSRSAPEVTEPLA